jgi:hypothetical protein
LDELLGEEQQQNDLVRVLAFLATKEEEDVVEFSDGATATVNDIYGTIRGAIGAAAAEAAEEDNDRNAVSAPLTRAEKAIAELKRAAASLAKARRFDEWNESKLQEKLGTLKSLISEMEPS